MQTLTGRYVCLEPLSSAHVPSLRAITDPQLYRYLPDVPEDFDTWFAQAVESKDPLFFAAVVDGRAVGRVAIQRIDETNRVAEIGHVLWGPDLRRTAAATQAVFLLLESLFDRGFRRVEWKCDDRNLASKAAARRLGFTFEGVFRQHMIVKGQNRDTAWFAILDGEWPQRRQEFLRWLAPANFDAWGRQRTGLDFAACGR